VLIRFLLEIDLMHRLWFAFFLFFYQSTQAATLAINAKILLSSGINILSNLEFGSFFIQQNQNFAYEILPDGRSTFVGGQALSTQPAQLGKIVIYGNPNETLDLVLTSESLKHKSDPSNEIIFGIITQPNALGNVYVKESITLDHSGVQELAIGGILSSISPVQPGAYYGKMTLTLAYPL
jgi:hypothetical protein